MSDIEAERKAWSDRAASDFLLLDPEDLPAMAQFLNRLREESRSGLFADTADETARLLAGVLLKAADGIESIILRETDDSAAVMEQVGRALNGVQAVLYGCHPSDANLPEEFVDGALADSETGGESAPASSEANASALPHGVDETILQAYVEQQAAVVPEMEQCVLSYEKERDSAQLAHLRRMIHTLKGESGVVGALAIEQVCHRLEDALNAAGDVETDTLLAALDWIGKAAQAYGAGESCDDPAALLDMLSQSIASEAENNAANVTASRMEGDGPPSPEDSPSPPPIEASVEIGDKDLANDFVVEAQEHFEIADENLLTMESEPDNLDAVGAVFRAFHTIKGVSGFLGLTPVGDLAHVAETLLDEVRKGKRAFAGVAVDVTFAALDMLKTMMSDLRDALTSGSAMRVRAELPALIASIKAVLAGETPAEENDECGVMNDVTLAEENDECGKMKDETSAAEACRPPSASPALEGGRPLPPDPSASAVPKAPAPEARRPPSAEPAGGRQAPAAAGRTIAEPAQTMKVDAAKIDLLLDTIGELVIAEAIVAGDPDIVALKSLRIEKNLALLGKITRSLQDMGMAMRLVPVDPVFRKMARLVRDLSKKSGKHVDLKIEGGDTEIDKSMVEKLGDPLVHMIRNSMDHGLEANSERQAVGKPSVGHIVLRAYHKGGNIHIDIEDDGRGLDREAILAKAIERGIVQSGDGMSDQDVFSLIFEAGFSTAKQVTEISGRGVGMDVVRRNIEALHGNVLIRSTPGKGSVFTLVLPLTTAIIDGMLSQVGEEIYILPTLSILESFRPEPAMVHTVSGKGEMVSFRGALLPLFRLGRVFGVASALRKPEEAIVIVVEESGRQYGLMADEILGQQQVVIKPLGEAMGKAPGIAGASILASGRPGLILDIGGVIKLATEKQ